MGLGAGGSPGITHLVDWRQGVYTAVVVIVSASWGGSDGAKSHDSKQEDGLCSNSCYDTQPRTPSLWETGAACEVVIFESLFFLVQRASFVLHHCLSQRDFYQMSHKSRTSRIRP